MKNKPINKMKTEAVIVGGGAAGITAAYKLAECGKEVILLEKGESFLETNFSKISGFMGCETAFQKNKGITVASKVNLYKRLTAWVRGTVNTKLIKVLLENSAEAERILSDMGLSFLTYAEITNDKKYNSDLTWAPLHSIVQVGKQRTEVIEKALKEIGVKVMFGCRAQRLLMNDGCVAGVEAMQGDEKTLTISSSAVFLATGGFGNNKDMIKEWFNGADMCHMGSEHNVGDGIKMAIQAGAVTEKYAGLVFNELCGGNTKHGNYPFDEEWNIDNENLNFAIYGGLNVDSLGERFMDEGLIATTSLSYNGIASTSVGKTYVIMDGDYYEGCCEEGVYKYMGEPDWDYGRNLPYPVASKAKEHFDNAVAEGWAFRSEKLSEIATYFDLPNLESTVLRYNELCKRKNDEDFGKDSMFMREIKSGVGYVAIELTGSYWCTLGGVKTDSHLRSVDANKEVIPGIYIGGVEMGSAFGKSYYDIPANASGLAIASGVLAAREIINYLQEERAE